MKFIFIIGSIFAVVFLIIPLTASAQTLFFDNETAFLTATGTLSFESFEDLPTSTQGATPINTADFTISPDTETLIGILNTTTGGVHAIDGTQYLASNASTGNNPSSTGFTLNFNQPINTLGFWITDFGDQNPGDLTFTNNIGDQRLLASYPKGNANEIFFGVINYDNVFTTSTILNSSLSDGMGMDSVHYAVAPEPISSTLFIVGGATLGFRRFRKKFKK